MKKILVFGISLLMATTAVFAQKHECNKQKGEGCKQQCIEHRVKAYVSEFALDEKSAEKFGDLFKAFAKEIGAIHQAHFPARPPKEAFKEGEKPAEAPQLSEEEIDKFTVEHFAVERELTDLSERYYKDFRAILKPSQASKVIREARFPHDKMHKPEGKFEGKPEGKHECKGECKKAKK